MTEKRRAVILHPDEVRNGRAGGYGSSAATLVFNMPFNSKSDLIREGGQVVFDGALYEVTRREDLRPPIVEERTVEFSLVPSGKDA